jgi:8-oxo-dGTP diphosphatase
MIRGIDYIGVGVGAIIINEQGHLFLAKRGLKAKNERNLWEFPGGAVEFGETISQALKREIYEEYGIEIKIGELLDVVDHILPQEKQHWVSPTFICTILTGQPIIREPEKCAAIGWFAVDLIPSQLTVISQQNLVHFRQYLYRIKNDR